MTDQVELLACPFCGERSVILEKVANSHVSTGHHWRAKCEECWASSHGSYHLDPQGAAKEWNTRAPDEHFNMLWKWFEERGAIDRYDWSDGKSVDDFKAMLDEHEADLIGTIEKLKADAPSQR